MGISKQWRIVVTAIQVTYDQYWSMQEIEFIENASSVDACLWGYPSSHSGADVTGLFDNSNSEVYLPFVSGMWVMYSFETPKDIRKYTITPRGSATYIYQSAKDWTLQYYDGSAWVVAHTVTNEPAWTAGVKKTFTLPEYETSPSYIGWFDGVLDGKIGWVNGTPVWEDTL